MPFKLYDYQLDAIKRLKTGSILCGNVGSGKSLTALGYYYLQNGGDINFLKGGQYINMDDVGLKDLYIITTAQKRDKHEWDGEMSHFLMSTNTKVSLYRNKIVVDSWNNITKYVNVKNSFFIFDEQRVIGNGAWVKTFLKITKHNDWILLSATPGDTWSDYIPVFIANGFYKNRTEFNQEHIVFARFSKYPKIDRYLNTRRLVRLRDKILVDMDEVRTTKTHNETIYCNYDIVLYKETMKKRWNPYTNEPMLNAAELCYTLRKIVNSDTSRQVVLLELLEKHSKAIIFYNFDYELEILKSLYYGEDVEIAEWNGHKHQPIPETKKWIYLVQYTAGCEGWNCIKTDTIIFFSQNYSYRIVEQAAGRINRINTPYTDLYYYHLKSHASIDISISRALFQKKKFNESRFIKW